MNTPPPTTDSRPSAQATAARETRVSSPISWLTLALALMLGLLVNNSFTSYRQAEADGVVMTRNLVQVLESRLSSDFAQTSDALAFLARRISEADLRPMLSAKGQAAISQQLVDLELSFPDAGGLTLFDAEGTLRHASDPKLKGINIADRPHFRALRDDPAAQIAFSDAQIARTTGKWSIVMVRALRDERGRFLGTVNAVITLDSIAKLFQSIDVGPGGVTLLRRSDSSKLVMRIPRNNEKDFNQPLPPTNPIRQRIEAGERTGTLSLIASVDGVKRLASFKMLDNAPFYVQVAIAKDHYLASWRQGLISSAILACGLLIGFGFAIWKIRKSMAAAEVAARRIAYREALFGGLFEQSGFLAGILDQSGRLLEVNQTALAVIGLRREEVIGQKFADAPWWSRDEDRAALAATLQAAAAGAAGSFEAVHPHTGGGEMTVQCHAVPVQAGNERYIAVTGIDITARKHAEEETALRQSLLVESESRFRAMADSAPVLIWVSGADKLCNYFNKVWLEFTGRSIEQEMGNGWVEGIHPDDFQHCLDTYMTAFDARQAFSMEYRLRRFDGEYRWLVDNGVPRHDDQGTFVGYIGSCIDITARKQVEQALYQNTAALARSNAELEQFAYVASHDLRQPLRMVNSYVQLLERRLTDKLDAETREMMHFATDGAKRMDQMLVSLLEYSRVGRKGEPLTALASHDAVDEALRFLAPAINEANATVRVSGDWPEIVASRDEFTRLWQNLIGNAVKYRVLDRAPEIDITVTPDAEGNGDGWRFCVADNGIGIEPTQFERLFCVFQRLHTREQYEGTGIGLAVARKIVERHGGRIWVESGGDGQGCRFCFSLPKALPVEATEVTP